MGGEFAGKAAALIVGLREFGLQLRTLGAECFGRGAGAAVEFGQGGAQIGFRLARGFDFGRQVAQLSFVLRQDLRLISQAVFQIHGAAAEDFGLGRLRDKLLLELGDAPAEIFDLGALLGEFLRRRLEFQAF